jgi:hypothetical protein
MRRNDAREHRRRADDDEVFEDRHSLAAAEELRHRAPFDCRKHARKRGDSPVVAQARGQDRDHEERKRGLRLIPEQREYRGRADARIAK